MAQWARQGRKQKSVSDFGFVWTNVPSAVAFGGIVWVLHITCKACRDREHTQGPRLARCSFGQTSLKPPVMSIAPPPVCG
jgi:hypothetical protein